MENNCHFGTLFGTGIVEAKPLDEIEKLVPIWGPFKPECHFRILLCLTIWKGSKMSEACNDPDFGAQCFTSFYCSYLLKVGPLEAVSVKSKRFKQNIPETGLRAYIFRLPAFYSNSKIWSVHASNILAPSHIVKHNKIPKWKYQV